MVFLEECLEKEPRTYNSVQLAQKLEYANCQEMAAKLGITKWLLSISHTPSYATASAIAVQSVAKPIALYTEFREKIHNQTIEQSK